MSVLLWTAVCTIPRIQRCQAARTCGSRNATYLSRAQRKPPRLTARERILPDYSEAQYHEQRCAAQRGRVDGRGGSCILALAIPKQIARSGRVSALDGG